MGIVAIQLMVGKAQLGAVSLLFLLMTATLLLLLVTRFVVQL